MKTNQEPIRVIKTENGYFRYFSGENAVYVDDLSTAFRFYCGLESALYTANFLGVEFEIVELGTKP